jgi:uncharacterized membrane protein YGL010W
MNYEDYHTNTFNKIIHFFCIPIIVLTTCNLLSNFKFERRVFTHLITLRMEEIVSFILIVNYIISYGPRVYFIMCIYFFVIHILSFHCKRNKNCMKYSVILFVLAWIVQFAGHAIEGSRPALMTSITQAFSEAPLFSISYILPFDLTSKKYNF